MYKSAVVNVFFILFLLLLQLFSLSLFRFVFPLSVFFFFRSWTKIKLLMDFLVIARKFTQFILVISLKSQQFSCCYCCRCCVIYLQCYKMIFNECFIVHSVCIYHNLSLIELPSPSLSSVWFTFIWCSIDNILSFIVFILFIGAGTQTFILIIDDTTVI